LKDVSLAIEDFGGRLATVWSGLRPATRGIVERALQSANAPSQPRNSLNAANAPYDARSDHELSLLLTALDERASETVKSADTEKGTELRHIANTCAAVLQEKTRSAEVFAQLVRRADNLRDYARIDALADALTRFAPSEICELARSQDVVVRALANETLAQVPTSMLFGLLSDPVDSEIARDALRRQVVDYGSEEAREIVNALDQMNLNQDDL
jgi:signal transduction histidine kinase